ncbi:general L-amino acid transport system permease protein [Kaistia hirudinis]|uniref:General L-amino acid transport system permease protein n=1 Tax=Kaistia hirudinis TaxID=1293440 RepID=A0A840ATE9_9HYPH|nr:amino acid ABC transporter permease [Kaistia hirudinis]MBB3932091.1 general L-amino acid transport system permease protein [Kaistia hirudinis]
MTDSVLAGAQARPAPPIWPRLRRGLLGSPVNIAITLAMLALAAALLPPLLRWAVFDAVWSGTPQDCAAGTGACWAFIGNRLRFILFGLYPPAGQWAAGLASLILIACAVLTAIPRFWGRRLGLLWLVTAVSTLLLMSGVFGGRAVPTGEWGGLPLTLMLTLGSLGCAFPIAVVLALARRSKMIVVRSLAIGFIELVRGVPMIAVLYVAMLIFPLLLPAGASIDKLLRIFVALTLFVAAYFAEVIRAGLQAVPAGQREAAASLGFTPWQNLRLVIMPQAIRIVIPGIANLAIGILLNTTLVSVVGMMDLLNAAKTSASDPAWIGRYDEAYLFVAVIYFVIAFGGSRYSLWLERRAGPR